MTDLLVANAKILDGTGDDAFDGFVEVRGDRISRVGAAGETPSPAERSVDAGGRVLTPGFIDVHDHSDLVAFSEPWMESALRQGVTTLVMGNCGISGWPVSGAREWLEMLSAAVDVGWTTFAGYLEALEATRPAVNLMTLVGHGSIRGEVMGRERRPPSPDERGSMRRLLVQALEAGAAGLSTGLVYAPGFHADTHEITELASELPRFGGVYASHIRGEGETLFASVAEAVEIGRRSGAPVQISHLKCESDLMWGRAGELLEAVRGAREAGVDVTADQYPYTAYGTDLASFLPPWAPAEELPQILADTEARERLVRTMHEGEGTWQSSVKGVGWDRIVVTRNSAMPEHAGRSVAEIAGFLETDPDEAAFRLLVGDPNTEIVGHAMDEEDVRTILTAGDVMVASDATATSPSGGHAGTPVHPRTYGTFPRVLGHYVRTGLLPLAAAVRKMTSMPAERFGLRGRGRIAEGAIADLACFDPDGIADTATYGDPHRFPEGVELVVVGGRVAWSASDAYVERAGGILRRRPT